MLRKFCLMALVCSMAINVCAQENSTTPISSSLKFSGSLDGYVRQDFGEDLTNNKTSFTNSYGKFMLGMLSGKADYTYKKLNVVADIGIGKRAKEFAYNDKGIVSSIKQLYASLNLSDNIKLTAGTWATHVGYEVLDPNVNRNYSMSYMFSYGPFLHTGLKADFTFGKSGFMIGIANPTDYRKAPTGNKKSLLAQYSLAVNDDIKVYLNYVGGQRPTDQAKTRQIDAVLTSKLSDKVNIGYNGTFSAVKAASSTKNDFWYGNALYLNYDPRQTIGLTMRTELFSDKKRISALSSAAYGGSIVATTISANVKVGPVMLIPEFRFENCSNKIFHNKIGSEKNGTSSLVLGAYYKF
ncbi:MAG: outer membrane beta-barrel protein [Chitinophagaceae bacterium]